MLSNLFTLFSSEVANRKKDKIRLRLVKTFSDAKANVFTDSIRLEQVLFNLIDNAFNSTHEGTIEFGYQLDTNETIKFFVRDTGIGIEPEQQKNIFKRYHSNERPYIKSTEGTGLGLSICKGLVNLLGGNIWFETVVGEGTTFYFTIPYEIFSTEGDGLSTVERGKFNEVDFTNKKILVVEDDLISYQLIEALLSRTNGKIIHVKNGEDAVEVCKLTSGIDIVIMDMRLPFISGYEATEQILKHNPDMKIIAQTANVLCEDKDKCFKAGCIDYIPKPIDPDEFLKLVSKHLLGVVNKKNS
jgi:CheY-like chemotaxis protein/anti-sigma regulatory factor (Ser/Thr protein kinase)